MIPFMWRFLLNRFGPWDFCSHNHRFAGMMLRWRGLKSSMNECPQRRFGTKSGGHGSWLVGCKTRNSHKTHCVINLISPLPICFFCPDPLQRTLCSIRLGGSAEKLHLGFMSEAQSVEMWYMICGCWCRQKVSKFRTPIFFRSHSQRLGTEQPAPKVCAMGLRMP